METKHSRRGKSNRKQYRKTPYKSGRSFCFLSFPKQESVTLATHVFHSKLKLKALVRINSASGWDEPRLTGWKLLTFSKRHIALLKCIHTARNVVHDRPFQTRRNLCVSASEGRVTDKDFVGTVHMCTRVGTNYAPIPTGTNQCSGDKKRKD